MYNNTSNVGDNVGDVSEIKLTERQQKIINLIRQSPSVTAKQMSETLSVSSRTIERDLSALKEAGELMRDGKDNDGVWVIIKPKSVIRISLCRTAKRNPLIFPI